MRAKREQPKLGELLCSSEHKSEATRRSPKGTKEGCIECRVRLRRRKATGYGGLGEHKCSPRVVGRAIKWTGVGSRTQMGNWSIEGDTPVDKTDKGREYVPEYHGTLEILWESGWTIIQG